MKASEDAVGVKDRGASLSRGMTSEQIVDTLEEDIIFGYLNPRERLIEDDLRERFSATRHAIRRALADLEKMGLVEHRKNVGAMVKAYSPQEATDLCAVRHILETNCARQIALPTPPERLQPLIDAQRRHDAAVRTQNMRAAFTANIAFHRIFFRLADNAILAALIEDFARRAHVIRFMSMVAPDLLEKAREDHWEIIRALREGDADGLARTCGDHLLPSRDAYLAQYRRRGER